MKLAEALIERADLQKRAAQLEERLVQNMQVQEGQEPSEDPRELLQEFLGVVAALDVLLPRIHRANLAARLPGGLTLTDALARRDMLDLRLKVLRRAAAAATLRRPGRGWRCARPSGAPRRAPAARRTPAGCRRRRSRPWPSCRAAAR